MYEVQYSQNLDNTFLILKGIKLKIHEEKMISQNEIPNLVRTMFKVQDNEPYIYYDITSTISIKDYVKKYSPKEKWIKNLFISILELNDISKEYFLSSKLFLIKPEYIFYNSVEDSFSFIYVPSDFGDEALGFLDKTKEIIDFLFTKLNKYDEVAIKLMYKLKLVTEEEFITMNDIRDVIEQEQLYIDHEEKVMPIKIVPKTAIEKKRRAKFRTRKEQIFIYITLELCIIMGSSIGFYELLYGNNDVLFKRLIGAILGLTIILSQVLLYIILIRKGNEKPLSNNMNPEEECLNLKIDEDLSVKKDIRKPYLITEDQVKIPILKTPFVIGKLKGEVDCCINNSLVSRYHSIIESDEKNYYIMDMNSTNGTFLDNRKILSNNQYKIEEDSIITFANESYTFKLL